MTNKELTTIYNNISNIETEYPDLFKGKAKALYALIRNKKAVEAEFETYREAYTKIADEFTNDGKVEDILDKDGNKVDGRIMPEYIGEWIEAQNELDSLTVDVNIRKISIDDVEDAGLTLDILEKLDFMIEE